MLNYIRTVIISVVLSFTPIVASASVVAGTLVNTPDGARAIENLQVGDQVSTYNEKTTEIENHRITFLYTRIANNVVVIEAANSDGQIISINATSEHPFYTGVRDSEGQIKYQWQLARDLQVGSLLFKQGEKPVYLTKIKTELASQRVFNIEVAIQHNYFISSDEILVHNPDPLRLYACAYNDNNDLVLEDMSQQLRSPLMPGILEEDTVAYFFHGVNEQGNIFSVGHQDDFLRHLDEVRLTYNADPLWNHVSSTFKAKKNVIFLYREKESIGSFEQALAEKYRDFYDDDFEYEVYQRMTEFMQRYGREPDRNESSALTVKGYGRFMRKFYNQYSTGQISNIYTMHMYDFSNAVLTRWEPDVNKFNQLRIIRRSHNRNLFEYGEDNYSVDLIPGRSFEPIINFPWPH